MQDIIDTTGGGGGAGLKIKDDLAITSSLQIVADPSNTSSALRISTVDVSNFGNGGNQTNTAFGASALTSNQGQNQIAIGYQALQNHSNATYSQNIAIGTNALRGAADEQNVAIGPYAAQSYVDWFSVFIGAESAYSSTGGTDRVNIGYKSGYSCNTGAHVGVGSGTFQNSGSSGGDSAVAIGAYAQQNVTGNFNTAIGWSALQNGGATCSNNIAIGYRPMQSATSAQHNIAMGEIAGQFITSGTNNINIGSRSGPLNTTAGALSNCLAIGREAKTSAANEIAIGSAAYPFSPVLAGAQTQTHYWVIKINGTDYKVLLAS